jgi:hypothetical protein
MSGVGLISPAGPVTGVLTGTMNVMSINSG